MKITKCSKCGKTVSDDVKFCPDCGGEIQRKEHKNQKAKEPKRISYKSFFISLVVIIFAIIIIFVPTKQVAYSVEIPYNEYPCSSGIEIRGAVQHLDNPNPINDNYECPDRDGYGLAYYGNMRFTWDVMNNNYIDLNIPCDIILKDKNYQTGEFMNERVVNSQTIYLPARGEKTITEDVYLPKCWDFADIECHEDELSACQKVTKYKSETEYKTVNWFFG